LSFKVPYAGSSCIESFSALNLVYYIVTKLWQLHACLIFRHISLLRRIQVAAVSMLTGLQVQCLKNDRTNRALNFRQKIGHSQEVASCALLPLLSISLVFPLSLWPISLILQWFDSHNPESGICIQKVTLPLHFLCFLILSRD
jgi:hypothetical protein